jgi:hypothetical protein
MVSFFLLAVIFSGQSQALAECVVGVSDEFTFSAFLLTLTPQVSLQHQEKDKPLQLTVPPPWIQP